MRTRSSCEGSGGAVAISITKLRHMRHVYMLKHGSGALVRHEDGYSRVHPMANLPGDQWDVYCRWVRGWRSAINAEIELRKKAAAKQDRN